jgi:hypothetical protein
MIPYRPTHPDRAPQPGCAAAEPHRWTGHLDRATLPAVLVLATFVHLQFDFDTRASFGDAAVFDYFSQLVARGGVPYRDAVDFKAPLSFYLGGASILLGRLAGLRDILATRLGFLALGIATVGLTWRVARDYGYGRRVALLAALILLGIDILPRVHSAGVQPKTPVLAFGLCSLLALRHGCHFLAGGLGMLAALSWQPGLLFVGAAGLAASRYLTVWRKPAPWLVAGGAALPLATVVAYFWSAGALRELYLWTLHHPYVARDLRGAEDRQDLLPLLADRLPQAFGGEVVYLALAAIGLILALWRIARHARRQGLRSAIADAPRHAIVVATLSYLAFCAVDFQGGYDLIPLLAFVAIFAADAIRSASDRLAVGLGRIAGQRPGHLVSGALFAGFTTAVVAWAILDAVRESPQALLGPRERAVRSLTSRLEPGDPIFVFGPNTTVDVLTLSGMTNADRYFFRQHRVIEIIDAVEPGGFPAWLETVKATRPKLVVVGSRNQELLAGPFGDWVRQDYQELQGSPIQAYILRPRRAGARDDS